MPEPTNLGVILVLIHVQSGKCYESLIAPDPNEFLVGSVKFYQSICPLVNKAGHKFVPAFIRFIDEIIHPIGW